MGRMLVAGAALLMLAVFNVFPAFGGPSVRTVTNTNDSGAGSLRQAIIDADASNTNDTIVFQSGVTGTITLTSGALSIVFPMNIVGPGASNLGAGKMGDMGGAARRARSTSWPAEVSSEARGVFTSH
jgi:hypothetical protein